MNTPSCNNKIGIVLKAFDPLHANELELIQGNMITVIAPMPVPSIFFTLLIFYQEGDWWEGFDRITNKFGYFPRRHIKLISDPPPNLETGVPNPNETIDLDSLASSLQKNSSPLSGSVNRHSRGRKNRSKSALGANNLIVLPPARTTR
jgi:hypothetical protein